MTLLLLAIITACTDSEPPPPIGEHPADSGVDTADATPAACEPLTLSVTQEWLEEDLPARESYDRRRPGLGMGDLDGDGDLDVLMAFGSGSMGLRNDGSGWLVEDDSFTADGAPLPVGSATALADLDGDGDLDAWLGREWDLLDLLLINDGSGAFTSVEIPGSEAAPATGVFGDLDGDGDLDLFVGTVLEGPDPWLIAAGEMVGEGPAVYLNQGGRLVRDDTRLPAALATAMTWEPELLDYDGDHDLDVYLANDFGDLLVPNQLLINDGAGTFSLAEDCYCTLEMHAMGSAVGDVNGDRLPDLFLTDIGGPKLLVNLGDGSFVDETFVLGADIPAAEDRLSSWGTAFADLNRDRNIDLPVLFGHLGRSSDYTQDLDPDWVDGDAQRDALLVGTDEGGFTLLDEAGFQDSDRSRVVVVGDLDGDGRPDLVTAGKHFLRVWRTQGGCSTGIRVRARDGANREGIGARVTVTAGGRETTQWMLPGGTASSSAPELTFGLAGGSSAERVELTWLDGAVEQIDDVPSGEDILFER